MRNGGAHLTIDDPRFVYRILGSIVTAKSGSKINRLVIRPRFKLVSPVTHPEGEPKQEELTAEVGKTMNKTVSLLSGKWCVWRRPLACSHSLNHSDASKLARQRRKLPKDFSDRFGSLHARRVVYGAR